MNQSDLDDLQSLGSAETSTFALSPFLATVELIRSDEGSFRSYAQPIFAKVLMKTVLRSIG